MVGSIEDKIRTERCAHISGVAGGEEETEVLNGLHLLSTGLRPGRGCYSLVLPPGGTSHHVLSFWPWLARGDQAGLEPAPWPGGIKTRESKDSSLHEHVGAKETD